MLSLRVFLVCCVVVLVASWFCCAGVLLCYCGFLIKERVGVLLFCGVVLCECLGSLV